jgi:predicted transcriptional regulator
MYQLPQEIEARYIIPAVRRDLSKCLVRDHKISYDKVGRLLGVTKAAVSQYLSEKRASKIKLHPVIGRGIDKSCKRIVRGKSDALREITKILMYIRKKKLHCEVCGKKVDGELHDCKQIIANYLDEDF